MQATVFTRRTAEGRQVVVGGRDLTPIEGAALCFAAALVLVLSPSCRAGDPPRARTPRKRRNRA